MGEDIALLLVGFIGILFAAYLTTRLLGTRAVQLGHGKYIKLLDHILIGKDKWICLIQMGDKYYLIATNNQHIELLEKIEEGDIFPLSNEKEPSFYGLLGSYLKKIKRNQEEKKIILENSKHGYLGEMATNLRQRKNFFDILKSKQKGFGVSDNDEVKNN